MTATWKATLFTMLLACPAAAQAKADEEARRKAEAQERHVTADIAKNIDTIKAEAKKCTENGETVCASDALYAARFRLRDQLAEARRLRADLRAAMDDEKSPDELEKLSARDVALLRAIESAGKIKFFPEDERARPEELIGLVRLYGELLTDAEAAVDACRTACDKTKSERAAIRSHLARLERSLRAQTQSDRKAIGKIDEELKTGELDSPAYAELIAKRKRLQTRVKEASELVFVPADEKVLYRVFDDDEIWVHQFHAGVEFDNVDSIFDKGFARIGYTSVLRLGGEDVPESHPAKGWWYYGTHAEFSALLTSSAEQDVDQLLEAPGVACSDTDGDGATDCVRKALEVEQKWFVPLMRWPRRNRLRYYMGPVVNVGAKYVDDRHHADYRYYGGIHIGFARDAYSEITYGKTKSLHTRRLEIRGETPVAMFGDSRLILGAIGNFRAGGRRPPGETIERDVIRIYLSYEVDFLKLTGFKGKE